MQVKNLLLLWKVFTDTCLNPTTLLGDSGGNIACGYRYEVVGISYLDTMVHGGAVNFTVVQERSIPYRRWKPKNFMEIKMLYQYPGPSHTHKVCRCVN